MKSLIQIHTGKCWPLCCNDSCFLRSSNSFSLDITDFACSARSFALCLAYILFTWSTLALLAFELLRSSANFCKGKNILNQWSITTCLSPCSSIWNKYMHKVSIGYMEGSWVKATMYCSDISWQSLATCKTWLDPHSWKVQEPSLQSNTVICDLALSPTLIAIEPGRSRDQWNRSLE